MLKIYNTLTGKKEILKSFDSAQAIGSDAQARRDKKLKLFVCGPTVYDYSHIGHARTYVAFDMIVKYLREKGYDVFYLQNITDIDDKIIKRAAEKNLSPEDLAAEFEGEYMNDMTVLRVNSVTRYAKAIDHISEIISQVKRLIENGFAYQIEDGIYYDISKFKDYGKLSGRTFLRAEDAVSRIDENKKKKNKGDFCLWKLAPRSPKGEVGFEPSWKSPWGWGRPGWHIEDTAIAERHFGTQYDIHGGARDLIFPHHEAEIAQMEALSGKKPIAKYWMHTGFLTISGQKMSKSLGNFITIKDFLTEHSSRELRLFVLKNHYRSPIDYSKAEIESVRSQLKRIDEFTGKLNNVMINMDVGGEKKIDSAILRTEKKFYDAMDDDFGSPKAIAVLFDFIKETNQLFDKSKIDSNSARKILTFLKKIDIIFGFLFFEIKKGGIPQKIIESVQKRIEDREKGIWTEADKIRKEIEKDKSYHLKDTNTGTIISKDVSGGTISFEIKK